MDQNQPTLLYLHSVSELKTSRVQIQRACPKSMEIYEDYIPAQMILYQKIICKHNTKYRITFAIFFRFRSVSRGKVTHRNKNISSSWKIVSIFVSIITSCMIEPIVLERLLMHQTTLIG